ncbi:MULTISPECIES: hypothetical protein [unclassified Bradyrhizobium]|uniref:hypothetical protein n=1 Tax=unclassified Bradyrhizobium TaxID=2631580 RepID=UPI001FFAE1E0|nr:MULTISPECIES: hypothetical protein [unclassified Bradyrhizobium]MCK1314068.1 hypothetical protein [Bradyrhizobium sp. 23]MCK1333002.1 hypothetical protein [Bradyrhizobium sp. CW9]MCK1449700.1 hypothetical protein [Bradyrhizobium sp. 35]MCK1509385.1 hypothetical protein [Bradyrhizobium sp. 18]MCK1575129.1 hypothetical protein [Bradyrhizobium sp. 174]
MCQFRDKIFCDRLINLQTAKIAGAIVPISQALQIVLAQPTKGKAPDVAIDGKRDRMKPAFASHKN